MIESDSPSAFLKRADATYQSLLARALHEGTTAPLHALDWIGAAARVATAAHTGRFTDGVAEQLLLDIGREHVRDATAARRVRDSGGVRQVVHVATRLLPTGGHTRLLINWIRNDVAATHRIVLTDQPANSLPPWVVTALAALKVPVTILPQSASWIERARALREIVRAFADTVLLHTHQFDVVAPLALAVAELPPVAVVNHSDHGFWLGAAVADSIVCIRQFAWDVSAARRAPRHLAMVPIPLAIPDVAVERRDARARLGLEPDDVALLTISAPHKLTPTPTHDFFAVAAAILRRHQKAHIYVVGTRREDVQAAPAGAGSLDRLHLVGMQTDATVYQRAADIYLEGIPYGSLTALLESVALGAYPVVMYAPTPQLDVSDDPGLAAVVARTNSLDEYLAHIDSLIENETARVAGAALARDAMLTHHAGDEWRTAVARLYAYLDGVSHSPGAPPNEPPRAELADLNRAAWDSAIFRAVPLSAAAAPALGTLSELFWLIGKSFRAGDTRLTYRHAYVWLSAIKHHFVGYPLQ